MCYVALFLSIHVYVYFASPRTGVLRTRENYFKIGMHGSRIVTQRIET